MFLGKNSCNLLVVIQISDLVVLASALYFTESKKDNSFFLAVYKGFISVIKKSFLILRLGNNLLAFIFFFLKNIFFH